MDGSERTYARIYRGVQRRNVHEFVAGAVDASGGRVIFSSGPGSAPLFLGVESPEGERIGLAAYVFAASAVRTTNRPSDEHRAQIRYGDVNSREWREAGHPLGFDPTGVDLTAVLVAHPDAGLVLALDPLAYDPLPLGNSIYFKEEQIADALRSGWAVWERNTHGGTRKGAVEPGLETIVAFRPERLFDFLSVERQAQSLRLDQALRFRLAESGAGRSLAHGLHDLERAFGLPYPVILDIVGEGRVGMAVRGRVAEHHLGLALARDPAVASARQGLQEGPPDFFVGLVGGGEVTVECKNASPKAYADGTPKVEVQKTRASKGDPTSRFYSPQAFDVIAACLFGLTGQWTFVYRRSDLLTEHAEHAGRIAPLQRITDEWSGSLAEALQQR